MSIYNMKKGDKIKDIKNGSIHIIESIESFDDNTVIFTVLSH